MFEEKDDDEMIRQMLGKATHRTAPAGLGDTIMQQVRAEAARRIRKRLILVMTLKLACIAFLIGLFIRLILQGVPMENLSGKNIYFLFPLLVLLLGKKAIKAR